MDSTELIRLDGGMLEGGGQLLRIAIALSALLSKPVAIDNIRAGRQSPGLKNQHAAGMLTKTFDRNILTQSSCPGLRLVAEICSARLEGCEVKSTSITFYPTVKPQTSKPYTADPKTAGSIALLLQVSLPCLIFAPSTTAGPPSELILRGGTNAPQAPQIDYMQHVLLPFIQKHFGVPATLSVATRGYYPKGGGEVHVSVPPVLGPLPAVTLIQRGAVKAIHGRSYVAGLPKSLAEAMRVGAMNVLSESGVDTALVSIDAVREKPSDAFGSGSGIVLWAETENGCILAGSALGSKRIDPAQVGRDAARELVANLAHGGCVDEYLQVRTLDCIVLDDG